MGLISRASFTTRTSDWVFNPDLNRVDEVGFTDLMPGAVADNGYGTSGASRVDWIELFANKVPRSQANFLVWWGKSPGGLTL